MEYYSALKKKEMLTRVITWMNLEAIMLSEISQSSNVWCCLYEEVVKFRETESRRVGGQGLWGGRGGKQLFNRCRVSVLQDEKTSEIRCPTM